METCETLPSLSIHRAPAHPDPRPRAPARVHTHATTPRAVRKNHPRFSHRQSRREGLPAVARPPPPPRRCALPVRLSLSLSRARADSLMLRLRLAAAIAPRRRSRRTQCSARRRCWRRRAPAGAEKMAARATKARGADQGANGGGRQTAPLAA
eukprot:4241761-Pleurochrysis_carterae.AAC.2